MEMLEWDARSYDALPLPHEHCGATAIAQLQLEGQRDGPGPRMWNRTRRRTPAESAPDGHVVAVDGSRQMLTKLRRRLTDDLERVTVVQADLRQTLVLAQEVDAALSVATLHWLSDHAAVFGTIAAVLRPGGQFIAEGGGHGNIETFRTALREVSGADGAEIWNFADVQETTANLRTAGFTDIDVRLVFDPARLELGEQLEAFIATVMLGVQLREMSVEDRRPLVHEVAQRLPEPVIDYVRLQIRAVRA